MSNEWLKRVVLRAGWSWREDDKYGVMIFPPAIPGQVSHPWYDIDDLISTCHFKPRLLVTNDDLRLASEQELK